MSDLNVGRRGYLLWEVHDFQAIRVCGMSGLSLSIVVHLQ